MQSKLELVVGIPASSMRLKLRDETGTTVCTMDGDDTLLGAFPVRDFMGLYVRVCIHGVPCLPCSRLCRGFLA